MASNNLSTIAKPKNARLFWIHCNRCFEFYAKKRRNFLILACNHVCCEQCVKAQPPPTAHGHPSYKCSICNNLVRGRLMCNNLPPTIKELFHPQPWLDGLPTLRILKFQQKHKQRFLDAMKKKQKDFFEIRQNTNDLRLRAKNSYEQLQDLIKERRELEIKAAQINDRRKIIEQERLRLQLNAQRRPAPPSSSDTSGIVSGAFNRLSRSTSPAVHKYTPRSSYASVRSFVHQPNVSFDL